LSVARQSAENNRGRSLNILRTGTAPIAQCVRCRTDSAGRGVHDATMLRLFISTGSPWISCSRVERPIYSRKHFVNNIADTDVAADNGGTHAIDAVMIAK